MRSLKISIILIFSVLNLQAQQEITFSNTIAEILYNNCSQCHRAGEIGPFPITSFEEVEPWAEMIKFVTSTRQMPPWKADPTYSRFLGERFLSQEQIDQIAEWVDNGSPRGNPDEEPELPTFVEGSQIGTPDLVLSFSEAFTHKGGNEDEYRVFVLPTGFAEDKQIATIELRPGNTKIVHHALFTFDTEGIGRGLDEEDEQYGYDGFGGFGFDGWYNKMLPGYVPGQKPILYPEGMGQTLPAGSDLLIQVHYAPIPFEQTDSSSVNIFFKKEPVERNVENVIMLPFFPFLQDDLFFLIPPNEVKKFHCSFTSPIKASLVSIWPHAHLLGQNWEVYIAHKNGDTTNLISIPDWDFNWQGSYHFKKLIVIEPGDVVHGYATYDNTIGNPSNPNNPAKLVGWGEKTTDEMFFLPVSYVPYKEGDEDLILDDQNSTSIQPINKHFAKHQLLPPFPNPNDGSFKVSFNMNVPDIVSIQVLDLKGRLVNLAVDQEFFSKGVHTINVDNDDTPSGVYLVQMRASNFSEIKKVSITR